MNDQPLSGRLIRLRRSENRTAPPSDFDDFWARTLIALLGIPPEPREISFDWLDDSQAICAEFTSWGGERVRCWFSQRHGDSTPRPLLVTGHGYGGRMESERVRRLASFGFNVVGVDFRGFGLSRNSVSGLSPYGYALTGIESRETSILRGAVCDYIQAYRAALQWFGAPLRTTFEGFSFSGGMSMMATGVLCMGEGRGFELTPPPPPDILAVGAPTFGYLEKRLLLCRGGSGAELIDYLRLNALRRHSAMRVLAYFDTCHFAPFIGERHGETSALPSRVIAGVGLEDPIVPAETVYAIYKSLSPSCELYEMPCSHTDRPDEAEWVRWEKAWLSATRDG